MARKIRIIAMSLVIIVVAAFILGIILIATIITGLSEGPIAVVVVSAIIAALAGLTTVFDLADRFQKFASWLERTLFPHQHRESERPALAFRTPKEAEHRYLKGQLRDIKFSEDLYVPLSIKVHKVSRFDVDNAHRDHPQRYKEYDDIAQIVSKYPQMVLVGDPGAGKSYTMRAVFRTAAVAYLNDDEGNCPFPLLINLGAGDAPVAALDLLNYWWDHHALPGDPEREYLHNNRLWLFLDGLNEMPAETREDRVKALREFIEPHPNTRVIATCRVRDYDDEKLKLGVKVIRVRELDEARIKDFLDKCGQPDLWEKFVDDALRRMAANPYYLQMLVEIHRDRPDLLNNLNDLNDLHARSLRVRYDEYIHRGILNLPWKRLKRHLQRLAFLMLTRGQGTSTTVQWAERRIGPKALKDGIDLHVLVMEGERLRFYHQSLHGYFAFPLLQKALRVRQSDAFFVRVRQWLINMRTRTPREWSIFRPRAQNRRVLLIQSIGDLGAEAAPAVSVLCEALDDADAGVRIAAINALGKIGTAAAPAIPRLIEFMQEKNDSFVPLNAEDALVSIDEPAIKPLIDLLHDDDWMLRQAVVRMLGKIGAKPELVIPVLARALRDRDFVREAAVTALRNFNEELIVPVLCDALDDNQREVRAVAVEILSSIENPVLAVSAIPRLKKLLHTELPYEEDVHICIDAARTLGNMGEELAAVIQRLVELLHNDDAYVRECAAEALSDMGKAAAPAVPILIEDLSYEFVPSALMSKISALVSIGEATVSAVPALKKLLQHEDQYVRKAAANAIEKITGERPEIPDDERS